MNKKPRACLTAADITVGMSVSRKYTITKKDVQKFGEIAEDFNPAHFDEEYAKNTKFGRPIAHGALSIAKISGVLGMDIPGLGAVWANQSIKFLAPVFIDEEHTVTVTATKVTPKFVVLSTICTNSEGKEVLTGEATMFPIPQKIKEQTDVSSLIE